MSKYKLKTLALISALPVFLTACTLQDLPVIGQYFGGGKSGELTVWGLWEKDYVIDPLFREYSKDNPNIEFKYEDMTVLNLSDLVEYKSRVFTRAAQNDWEADVVLVHNSWVPRLVASGLLEPMPEKYMTPAGYSQLFYPVATKSSVFNNEIYAVPAYYDGLALVYNLDHFEAAGLTNPPAGWEEFRRDAIELTQYSEEGDITRAGAAIGGADNIDHFSDILGLLWSQAGISIPSNIDSVSAQDALSFYTDLLKEHKVWRNDFPEATTAFVNGQVSMAFVPSWQILDIVNARPDLNFGVAPVPQALPDSPMTWGSFWVYVVPKTSNSKTAAWDFLNYLTTEEAEETLYNEASGARVFGPPHALVSLAPELQNNLYLGPIVQTAPYANSAEIASRSGNRRQVEALQKAVNDVLSGEVTVEQALSEAKTTINQ